MTKRKEKFQFSIKTTLLKVFEKLKTLKDNKMEK